MSTNVNKRQQMSANVNRRGGADASFVVFAISQKRDLNNIFDFLKDTAFSAGPCNQQIMIQGAKLVLLLIQLNSIKVCQSSSKMWLSYATPELIVNHVKIGWSSKQGFLVLLWTNLTPFMFSQFLEN